MSKRLFQKFIPQRQKAAIYLLIGLAMGLSVSLFLARDEIHYMRQEDVTAKTENAVVRGNRNKKETSKYNFRPFDPNTVSRKELLSFGLSEKQAGNIINYREKVSRFDSVSQLKKLYCMNDFLYGQIKDYVVIRNEKESESHSADISESGEEYVITSKGNKIEDKLLLDLNRADSLEMQLIPMIGPVRARSIYKYGRLLGGYVSIEQLKEVYGIDEKVYETIKPYFTIGSGEIRKLNINTDNVKELVRHPYIDYSLARAILRFRKEYGDFKRVEDLKKIHIMYDEDYERLKPYIRLSDKE